MESIHNNSSSSIYDSIFKNSLNEEQLDAVFSMDGPVLVFAGPGTGKTRVLTYRYLYLLTKHLMIDTNSIDQNNLNNISYRNILAVTFTNKAANEIHHRINELVNRVNNSTDHNIKFFPHNSWVGTFHSICLRILRTNTKSVEENLGYGSGFSVIDIRDQIKIIKDIAKDIGRNLGNSNNFSSSESESKTMHKLIYNFISKKKEFGSDTKLKNLEEDVDLLKKLERSFDSYQNYLFTNNLMDFSDIIINTIKLLKKDAVLLSFYREQFQFILVDEYQDTNIFQREFLQLILNQERNIFCVGDDDQCIYSWRGAIGSMNEFDKDFIVNNVKNNVNSNNNRDIDIIKAKIVQLVKNYRSTNQILATAQKLIGKNRPSNLLVSANNTDGDNVVVNGYRDSIAEASNIARKISINRGYAQFAILVRNNSQIRIFEEQFMINKVPYKVVGDTKFYESKEIQDITAYLKTILHEDDNLSFERVINTPKRGLGAVFVEKLRNFAKFSLNCDSLQKAARLFISDESHAKSITAQQKDNLTKFLDFIDYYRRIIFKNNDSNNVAEKISQSEIQNKIEKIIENKINTQVSLFENPTEKSLEKKFDIVDSNKDFSNLKTLIQDIVKNFEYYSYVIENDINQNKIEKINEFLDLAENFDNLTEFLDHVSLNISYDKSTSEEEFVSIMTIHAAKGLEFDYVFLPGWENGILPSFKSLDAEGIEFFEEERRLAYVALTRAKKTAVISYCYNRQVENTWRSMFPSKFVEYAKNKFMTINDVYISNNSNSNSAYNYNNNNNNNSNSNSINSSASSSSTAVYRVTNNSNRYSDSSKTGHKVFHKKFGLGTIISVNEDVLSIKFNSGEKKILDTFVEFQ
jgi:DNA helicase II / ATP-dependent DNA helicase PcrA